MMWWRAAEAAGLTATANHGPRWGTALDWAIALTLVVSASIIIGILLSRVLYRGRQTEGSALWLHLLVLGVCPLFLLAVGDFAVLEYATEVRFCASCHVVMQPYIDDLGKPAKESLAAAHFRARMTPGTECYSCHADYGVHGTFEAKLTGLRHVYRYWTKTYHLPIRMYAPFDNQLCLKCHDGAARFIARAIHLDDARQQVSPEFLNGETSCIQCHRPAHAVRKRRTAAAAPGVQ